MTADILAELSGIRVWRGFSNERLYPQRGLFVSQLKRIFIPQTAQQMIPLGLQAYFPAIIAKGDILDEIELPDEIALVVYPSDKIYKQATQKSVAGRAYGLLHSTVFNFDGGSAIPRSISHPPRPWQAEWEWDQAYALLTDAINWQQGQTSVLLAKTPAETSALVLYRLMSERISQWMAREKHTIDGAIICISRHYVLYWEHSRSAPDHPKNEESFIPTLQDILDTPYLCQHARVVYVPPVFSIPDEGVDCAVGELLSLQLEQNQPHSACD